MRGGLEVGEDLRELVGSVSEATPHFDKLVRLEHELDAKRVRAAIPRGLPCVRA